jgi:glycosyltransferase involved in cell wall biosynthesis
VRGRYVAICDSDDLSLPSRFERHVAFLDANPDIDIVSGQFRLFGGGIGPGKTISYPEDAAAIAARYARGLMGVVHGASMVRARCFDRHGLYREDLSRAEDFELFYRFSQVCRFRTLPDVVLEYRSGLLPSLRVWAETRRCHRYALYLADARRCRASAVTFEEFSRRWNTKLAIHTWELLRFFRYAVRVYVFSNPALR